MMADSRPVGMRRVILSYKMVNKNICTNFLPGLVDNGLTVEAMRCAPTGPRSGYSLVRIQGPPEQCERELADIDRRVGEWCTLKLTKHAPGDYIAMVSNNDCDICHLMPSCGCFVESARMGRNGVVSWTILGPDADSVSKLVADLRGTGREVVVHSSRDQSSSTGLTPHQVKALEIAFAQGYYDIPQRTTLEQLAPLVGSSKSSLNIVLRRAERKLLADFLAR